jgi:hypothetical protein
VLRAVIWPPGLVVAGGATAATAHGLFETAFAARVPAGIAWLYPLITDGLALVAYAATARLTGSPARYAWAVVVLAAGLSGLAQAAYLADNTTLDASVALRFGVGAWPAIAAAITGHLLYLLATPAASARGAVPSDDGAGPSPFHATHGGWGAVPALPAAVPGAVPCRLRLPAARLGRVLPGAGARSRDGRRPDASRGSLALLMTGRAPLPVPAGVALLSGICVVIVLTRALPVWLGWLAAVTERCSC